MEWSDGGKVGENNGRVGGVVGWEGVRGIGIS